MRPIAVMHGFVSSAACMAQLVASIQERFPDADVVAISGYQYADTFSAIDEQVEAFRKEVENHPKLNSQAGFDLVAHSLGGVIGRAYIQRYNRPRVHRFISIHSPQGGIGSTNRLESYLASHVQHRLPLPQSLSFGWNDIAHSTANAVMTYMWGASESRRVLHTVQAHIESLNRFVGQRTPVIRDLMSGSVFMRNLNSAGPGQLHRRNIESLDLFLMIKATNDEIVVPHCSQHFGSQESPSVINQPFFADLGLKTLLESGRLVFTEHEISHSAAECAVHEDSIWKSEVLEYLDEDVRVHPSNKHEL